MDITRAVKGDTGNEGQKGEPGSPGNEGKEIYFSFDLYLNFVT